MGVRRASLGGVVAALNLGSGHLTYPNAVNVDRCNLAGVDLVHDLDVMPWPIGDSQFDEVWATNLFEHVLDPIGFIAECWRVLIGDGLLHLLVPHWQSENAFTDPTHRRFCTDRTFDYWCVGTDLHSQFGDQYAGDHKFRKESVNRQGEDLLVYMRKIG